MYKLLVDVDYQDIDKWNKRLKERQKLVEEGVLPALEYKNITTQNGRISKLEPQLWGACLDGETFNNIEFPFGKMRQPSLKNCKMVGTVFKLNGFQSPDFTGSDMRESIIQIPIDRGNFSSTKLQKAQFIGAQKNNLIFHHAEFSIQTKIDCWMHNCDFSHVKFFDERGNQISRDSFLSWNDHISPTIKEEIGKAVGNPVPKL